MRLALATFLTVTFAASAVVAVGSDRHSGYSQTSPAPDAGGTGLALGPAAVSERRIDILMLAGLKSGEGQTKAARQSNAKLLQAAFSAADHHGLELDCPSATTIEIENTTGLLAAQTNNPGFRLRFDQKCNIVQFGVNTPILTIGDPTGNRVTYQVDWQGGEFNYGSSQTGQKNSICVLLGALNYSNIENILACDLPGSHGQARNPPWVAMQVGEAGYHGTGQWFSNTLRRVNIAGGQHALFAVYIGGTGSVWEDIYMHNGGDVAGAQPVSGNGALIDDPGEGHQNRSDDVWTRINVEHVQASSALYIRGVYNTTFIGLHCEDPQLNAYGSQVFAVAGSGVAFISPMLLDFHTTTSSGGPEYIFKTSYQARVQVENMKVKWSSVVGQINKPGVYFFSGNQARSDADDQISFEAGHVEFVDDSRGANAGRLLLEPGLPIPVAILRYFGRYLYDPVMPTTEQAEFTVPDTTFTLDGQHQNATIMVPASLAAPQTITLADTRQAAGHLFARVPAGSIVRLRRLSGHYRNPTTIRDGDGRTLATLSTAGTEQVYQSDGQRWTVGTFDANR